MYLLRRKISPYSGYDLILGIAKSVEAAEELKRQYVEKRLKYDPWREQAYHEVNLEKDTIIEDISTFFKKEVPERTTFFLVCHLEDYLGLASLKVHKIFGSKEVAENYMADFYEYCDLQEMLKHPEDFESEEIEESYIKALYERLDLDKEAEYFECWGGELRIYETKKDILQEEVLPAYDIPVKTNPQKVNETIFEKILNYFKKKAD